MTPTNKLRFVNRKTQVFLGEDTFTYRIIKILQQWWEAPTHDTYYVDGNYGEWRDVEVENE